MHGGIFLAEDSALLSRVKSHNIPVWERKNNLLILIHKSYSKLGPIESKWHAKWPLGRTITYVGLPAPSEETKGFRAPENFPNVH